MARKAVYRKPWFAVIAVAGAGGCAAVSAWASLAHPNGSDPVGAVILSFFAWFFWLVGWHSAVVRMDPAGVVVDSLFVRSVIPWSELEAIEVKGGLRFKLRDGSAVGCLMYGASVAGQLTGYPYLRRVAARMRNSQGELSPPAPETLIGRTGSGGAWHVSPWPPLLILIVLELFAVLGLLTR